MAGNVSSSQHTATAVGTHQLLAWCRPSGARARRSVLDRPPDPPTGQFAGVGPSGGSGAGWERQGAGRLRLFVSHPIDIVFGTELTGRVR